MRIITALLLFTSLSAFAQNISASADAKTPHTVTFVYSSTDPNFVPDSQHSGWMIVDSTATNACIARGHSPDLCRVVLANGGGFSCTYAFKRPARYLIEFIATDTRDGAHGNNVQKHSRAAITINEPFVFEPNVSDEPRR